MLRALSKAYGQYSYVLICLVAIPHQALKSENALRLIISMVYC